MTIVNFYRRSLGYGSISTQITDCCDLCCPMAPLCPDLIPVQGENFESVHGFHEGSSWQYSFAIPHDIEGLIRLHGRRNFVDKAGVCF
jgi:hypothetical protein